MSSLVQHHHRYQPEKHKDKILSLLQQGLTQYEIAQHLNTYQVAIHRYIKKLGLPTKATKHSRLNESRPRRYIKYYYCTHCKWIPKEEAVFKPKGSTSIYNSQSMDSTITYSTKKDGYYCPKCNNKLRIKKRKNNNNNNNNTTTSSD